MGLEFIDGLSEVLKGFGLAGVAAGGTFGMVKWFADFLSVRADKREERIYRDNRFIIDNLREELSRTNNRVAATEDLVRTMQKELTECHLKHAKAEAEVTKLTVMVESQQGRLK